MNFTERLENLEREEQLLQAELAELDKGQVKISLGDSTIRVDITELVAGVETLPEAEPHLNQLLQDNEPFLLMLAGQRNLEELGRDVSFSSAIPNEEGEINSATAISNTRLGVIKTLLVKDRSLTRWLSNKSERVARLYSGWAAWTILAVLVLLIWGGGPMLDIVTGRAEKLRQLEQQQRQAPATPTASITPGQTASDRSPLLRLSYGQFEPELTEVVSPTISPVTVQPTATPTNLPITTTATTEQSEEEDDATPPISGGRVGCPPTPAGGNNGPHGCFNAPSKIESKAVGLVGTISKAQVIEEVVPVTSTGMTTTVLTSTVQIRVVAPPANSSTIAHWGAYPGETGNMVLFGTNSSLALAHFWQVGDEIAFTDRKGNVLTYKVVPLSPTGQAERTVDLADPADAWLLSSKQDTAIATLILPLAQVAPVPQEIPSSTATPTANTDKPKPTLDDLTTTRRLAYRAVLVVYTATKTKTPTGSSSVIVPGKVWTPVGQSLTQITPSLLPSATLLPTSLPTTAVTSLTVAPTSTAPVTNGVGSNPPEMPGNLPNTGRREDVSAPADTQNNLFLMLLVPASIVLLALFGLFVTRHKGRHSHQVQTQEN